MSALIRSSRRVRTATLGLAMIMPMTLLLSACGDSDQKKAPQGPTLSERVEQLEKQVQQSSENASSIDQLSSQLAQQQDALKNLNVQVTALAEKAADTDEGNAEARLDALEQDVRELSDGSQQRLTALQAQVSRLEKKTQAARPKPAQASVKRRPAAAPTPMFSVLGVEGRGGQTFLAVADKAATAQGLDRVKLIQPGQSLGSWTLEHITARGGVFSVNGRHVPVMVKE
ncbi:hypothetical protein [Carnimonas bestiolae]|uniref:hypothetical protein n=1 Tax=Carnimonas bestiolae TaxID=3402172 RepID=UPI003EDC23B0